MPGHFVTFIFLTTFVATITCAEGGSRSGFRLFPSSPREVKGIVLCGAQLLFITAVYLGTFRYVDGTIVTALMTVSFFGLIVFGVAFWKSNRGQAIFSFALIGFGAVMAMSSPVITE